MKTLFVVTHTQSIHHVEKRVGGWYDTGLTPRGQTDAQATAEHLHQDDFWKGRSVVGLADVAHLKG